MFCFSLEKNKKRMSQLILLQIFIFLFINYHLSFVNSVSVLLEILIQ